MFRIITACNVVLFVSALQSTLVKLCWVYESGFDYPAPLVKMNVKIGFKNVPLLARDEWW